jgi:hypothetical protein
MAISGGIDWVTTQKALQDFVVQCTGLTDAQVVWAQQQMQRPVQPAVIMRLMLNDDNNTPWVDTENQALTIATITVTSVDDTANTFTKVAHGLETGDGPVRMSSTGTLPTNIVVDTDYWVIATSADTFKLAATYVDAINLTAIDLGDAGTGTITLEDTAETLRSGEEIVLKARSLLKATLTLECYTDVGVGMNMATSILWRIHSKRLLPTPIALLRDANIGVVEAGPVRSMNGTQSQYLFEPRAMMDITIYLASEDSENGTIIERAEIEGEDTGQVFTVDVDDPVYEG